MLDLKGHRFFYSVLRNRSFLLPFSLRNLLILLSIFFSFSLTGQVSAGQIWFNPNYLLIIAGPLGGDENRTNFTNYGTIYREGTTFTNQSGAVLNNYGLLDSRGVQGTLNNLGALNNFGTVVNTFYGTLNNNGILNNNGTLSNTNTNYAAGTLNNNGLLINNGTLTNSAYCTMTNNSSLENNGKLTNDNVLTNKLVLNNNADGTLNNTGTLNNYKWMSNGGMITNAGTLKNSFELTNYGWLTNNGTLNNDADAVLVNTKMMRNNGTFSNAGTLRNRDEGELTNNGTMTNQAGGWLRNTATLINYYSGTLTNIGTLDNSGTLENYHEGTMNNSGMLSNYGVLNNYEKDANYGDGTLTNSGTFSNYGTLNNNGILNNYGTLAILSGSFFNQNSSATYTGTGSIVLGGTLNNTSSSAFNILTLSLTGGVFNNNGTGPVNIATAMVAGGSTGTIQGTGPIGLTTANVDGTLTVSAPINGAGSLTKIGSGTLTLSGINTYTGGTTVNAGILEGNAASLQGAITNNSQVVFNQGTSGTYAGIMNGTGNLTKTGTGNLILSGNNTYTGATSIDAGVLSVNGSITSSVTVGAAGTLMGNGNITGDMINNGTLAPGNAITAGSSIGTMKIYGNYNHSADSVYKVDLNPIESDKLLVTGTATLNGGNVAVLAGSGTYKMYATYKYTILSAGSVTGTFASTTSNLAFLTPSLSYDPTNVYLQLIRNSTKFADIAQTENEAANGSALDHALSSATGDMSTVILSLLNLSPQEARSAFDQMGGLSHTALTGATFSAIDRYLNAVTDRMDGFITGGPSRAYNGGPLLMATGNGVGSNAGNTLLAALENMRLEKEEKPEWGFWMKGYGSLGDRKGDDVSSKYDYSNGGILIGFDRKLSDSLLFGISTGYSTTRVTMNDIPESGKVASYFASLYGSFLSDSWYINALISYGYNRYDTTRDIVFGDINRSAHAQYAGYALSGYTEVGCPIRIDSVSIIPMASLRAGYLSREEFNETDAGALNLSVERGRATSLLGALGVRLRKDYRTASGNITPEIKARWLHEFSNDDYALNASYAGAPASTLTIRGDRPTLDTAALGFGLTWQAKTDLSFHLAYDANFSNDHIDQGGSIGMRYTW